MLLPFYFHVIIDIAYTAIAVSNYRKPEKGYSFSANLVYTYMQIIESLWNITKRHYNEINIKRTYYIYLSHFSKLIKFSWLCVS